MADVTERSSVDPSPDPSEHPPASGADRDPSPTVSAARAPRALPPEPAGVSYDRDLERLCRIAASVGSRGEAPLSYTALLIAFLWGEDDVSRWFREYAETRPNAVEKIFMRKGITDDARAAYVEHADSGGLPTATPLYSRAARTVMKEAAQIAGDVEGADVSPVVLCPAYVMAAYAFRTPPDRRGLIREWGFDERDWQAAFLEFAKSALPDKEWSRLQSGVRPPVVAVSSFTSDDPLAPPDDLLDVHQEAGAFARIVAAKTIKPPLAIGIFGEWGSGKTFFMRLIYEKVEALGRRPHTTDTPALFHTDIVQIRFNAWHYIETNLWASLVEYIFAELDRWLLAKSAGARPEADLVFERLSTAQQLKLEALEDVVSRRAERRTAEVRAERARRDYEKAVARSAAVGAGTYARAMLETVLKSSEMRPARKSLEKALGVANLSDNAERVVDVLEQARTEAGRGRLMMRAGVARMGRGPWLLGVGIALVVVPLLVVGFKEAAAWLVDSAAIRSVHNTLVAVGGLLATAAIWIGALARHASNALNRVDEFDKALREQIEQQKASADPTQAVIAEDDLRKQRQELEAAERALAEADARLVAARHDFESATARSRLNAFIRAKATEGDYAKHLGIIATIRRDFGQLAALMGAASDSDEQRRETERLASEAKSRVTGFLEWLRGATEVRLTLGELRSLLSLLEPKDALAVLRRNRPLLTKRIDAGQPRIDAGQPRSDAGEPRSDAGEQAFQTIERELETLESKPLPKFSRIILYIDDLDRCPPETVVSVLQAVHLLLTFPLFTVVVAVDSRWVSRALRKQFPRLLAEDRMFRKGQDTTVSAGATSHDYLEKIFQIPYWVRPIDPDGARSYVGSLVDDDVKRATDRGEEYGAEASASAESASAQVPGSPDRPRRPVRSTRQPVVDLPREQQEMASLELTRWEAETLARFAPMVGGTPRRLIRFVNVYRLIKTSLPDSLSKDLVGTTGESPVYRGLVAQLAVVTGAPEACRSYFDAINRLGPSDGLARVVEALSVDDAFTKSVDHQAILGILKSAQESGNGGELTVEQLLKTAPIARRYSFMARHQQ